MAPTFPKPAPLTLGLLAGMLWPILGIADLDIPDSPLFLTSTGVAPNIVLTLDDSGSMSRAFTPDLCGNPNGICNNNPDSNLNHRYLKSSDYNPLYYNPGIAYTIPTDVNGAPVSDPTFSAAYVNGFEPPRGTVNLGTQYRPSAGLFLSKPGEGGVYWQYMNHYNTTTSGSGISDPIKSGTTHADVGGMIGVNSGSNAPYFVINDFANVDGSASGSDPGTNIVSVWVEGQSTPAQYNGTFTGTCDNSKDPASINRYKTKISGSTLTICFRDDNAMYGKQVTVTHQKAGGAVGYVPVRPYANATAYYYEFESSLEGCDGTDTDNDCYVLRIVGDQSGPADLDGDGDVDGDDERQNFANWYSFYRTRNLATVSATARAFGTLPETTRVAWQALNSCRGSASNLVTADCEGWEVTNPNFSNAINPFAGDHKSNFFTWLFRLKTNTSTPLPDAMERAGDYFSSSGSGSPYDNSLDAGDTGEYSCRKNFHVMMTDGIWNVGVPGYGNYDSTDHRFPDETQYDAPMPPFSDSNSASLADVAFSYWARDLRPDLDDTVPSYVTDFSSEGDDRYFNPKNDPATWQHMVNFTVGFGLETFLANTGLSCNGSNSDDGCTYAGSFNAIADPEGGTNWPPTSSSGADGNVADLWHAAINSRGKFYSPEKPDELVDAFQSILDTISTQATSGGGAGLSSNTSQIDQEGALIFEAKFNADWSGQLQARPVDSDLNLDEPLWDAGQRIPAPHARRIFTLNAGAQALQLPCAGGPLQEALDKNAAGDHDGLCAQRVNWLRGDGRVEDATWSVDPLTGSVTATYRITDHGFVVGDKVTVSDVLVSENPAPAKSYNGDLTITESTDDTFSVTLETDAAGPGSYASDGRVRYTEFRDRPISILGDIMGSDPVYVFKDDYGFGGGASAVDGKDAYGDYVDTKELKPPVIYVGANDGMLHAFCADNPDAPPADPEPACPQGVDPGEELFAYVPQGVYPHLSALTDPLYGHRFYVDGPPSVSDAYISGSWRTYLVGALGAGGKSVFALDVSDPANFDAEDVKWEFSDADDLGLTFGKPQIAPATSQGWAVIFGNGYNSTNDTAVLFVVDLADGSQIAKIPTSVATANGLSTPHLYDGDGDTIVDVVYAGDLQGNLWKFVNNGGTWTLGNDGDPLFTARNAANQVQPITAPPTVAPHPEGGVLIYFGTGSYLTHCDIGNPAGCNGTYDDQQSFYAIWDKPEATGTLTRDDLEPYLIIQETTTNGFTVRTTSEGTVDWTDDRGWYLDLPATPDAAAERVVSPALVLQFTSAEVPDRVLFVTNTPSQDPCTMGGTTWLMELDLISGGRPTGPVFDLDGSGSFDEADEVGDPGVPPSGVALDSSYGITGEPLLLTTEAGNIVKAFSGTTGKSGTDASPLQRGEPPPPVGGNPPTRLYWRQVL